MRLFSSLDQPFDAEIELIDVGSIPLAEIKASLAEPGDYQRVGLDRSFVLNSLAFRVEKKANGRTVIHLRSTERVSEPFVQLLIDLSWSKGQLLREYDVLLDPPDYQGRLQQHNYHASIGKDFDNSLAVHPDKRYLTRIADSVFPQEKIAVSQTEVVSETYGPTTKGETVWQIAGRLKTPGISLEQMVLVIVGMNMDAFSQNNLNGLKVGYTLKIPSADIVGRVPRIDAREEVLAHDRAWKTNAPIQHKLLPPYYETEISQESNSLASHLPKIPVGTREKMYQNSYLNANQDEPAIQKEHGSQLVDVGSAFKAQIDRTTQAIETVRETNALLKEELRLFNAQNKKLQTQLSDRNKELEQIHSQIDLLMNRKGVAGQLIRPGLETKHDYKWLWFLSLLGIFGGSGYLAWRKWDTPDFMSKFSFKRNVDETPHLSNVAKDEVIAAPPMMSNLMVESTTEELQKDTISSDTPLSFPVKKSKEDKPVKSKAALDTLLSSAVTYIDIGDTTAALGSLNEVLENGDEQQIAAAKELKARLS